MITNDALAALRQATDEALHGDHLDEDRIVRLAQQFRLLDQHLSRGGQLPQAWAQAPRPHTLVRQVDKPPIAVPGPEPLGGPVPGINGSHLPGDEHEPVTE